MGVLPGSHLPTLTAAVAGGPGGHRHSHGGGGKSDMAIFETFFEKPNLDPTKTTGPATRKYKNKIFLNQML